MIRTLWAPRLTAVGLVAIAAASILALPPSAAASTLPSFTFSESPVPLGTPQVLSSPAESAALASRSFVESPIPGASLSADINSEIRFVHRSGATGPVLMKFGNYSGGARPSLVYGAGSYWLFDAWTENGSEVLRISPTTGAVLQRTVMPVISRPQMAVNEYGFWMGQASNSFYSGGAGGVWLAPVGAGRGELLRTTNGQIFGMHESGDAMVIDVAPNAHAGGRAEAWRFAPSG